jgi:hypothetical protein
MSVEAIAASAAEAPAARVVELAPPVPQAPAPELAGRFGAVLDQLGGVGAVNDVPPALKGLLETLDKVNVEGRSVTDYAREAELSGGELTPGEVVQLTMRCQEFMFHCQLTSNIANRSSDGIQQLFRQQS